MEEGDERKWVGVLSLAFDVSLVSLHWSTWWNAALPTACVACSLYDEIESGISKVTLQKRNRVVDDGFVEPVTSHHSFDSQQML